MPDMLATLDRWPRPWTWSHCATPSHHVTGYAYTRTVPGCSNVFDANGAVFVTHIPEPMARLVAAAPVLVAAVQSTRHFIEKLDECGWDHQPPQIADWGTSFVLMEEAVNTALATLTPPAGGGRE